jgi:Spy/CpxP family protein refolding chaperone
MGLVPDPRMLAQLGLSDAQRDRIDAVHDQHLHGTARPHADLRVAMLDLTRLLERDAPDAAAIAAQARRIGELQSALLQARITAALSIRKVLTPAQRAKLRRLQAERTDAGPPAAPGP